MSAGKSALKKLREKEDINEELEEILAEGNNSENSSSMSVWQLLINSKLRLALFVTICMHLSQQLSGIVAIFYYSTKFFQVSLNNYAENPEFLKFNFRVLELAVIIRNMPHWELLQFNLLLEIQI